MKSQLPKIVVSLVFAFALTCIHCDTKPKERTMEERVKHGEYLVTIGGCNDCHSPKLMTEKGPEPDPARLLSGHHAGNVAPFDFNLVKEGKLYLCNEDFTAWAGPWGMSYAANLTPDATGLAGWTEEIFISALRTGKHMGTGRPILPPMPWFNFAMATDDDLKDIFAYLKSLKPVSNAVPAPLPPDAVMAMQAGTKK